MRRVFILSQMGIYTDNDLLELVNNVFGDTLDTASLATVANAPVNE